MLWQLPGAFVFIFKGPDRNASCLSPWGRGVIAGDGEGEAAGLLQRPLCYSLLCWYTSFRWAESFIFSL